MGIKHVWTILNPFCERKPLYELQGKTVAVDLSCWICEAQNVTEYEVQPRMYLRNLYFRTCYLLLMDVIPVFVLEGKAPELKYDTISARNAIQFKGSKPKNDKIKTGKDRSRFHHVLKRCEEMLGYLGIACVKGQGEAESMCAYLNEEGLVDGCISQDSDCFAYGAKVVYRNFSISTQGAYASTGGAVDIYDISKPYQSIGFGRNKIIAMALLCGSDYSEGVQGIGKESVLKLFETLSDEEALDRLQNWKTKLDLYSDYELKLSNKDICTSCGHSGKIQQHTKKGCTDCKTTTGCNPFHFKDERMRIKNELNMRTKALQDPNFPDENILNEYLIKKDNVSQINVKWRQPDIVNFVKFTEKFLQWDEIYSFEKILPVLTRWQCLNYSSIRAKDNLKGILIPEKIKKIRNPKGVPSYEIIWSDPHDFFKGLVPENQIKESNADPTKLWSTIEPQVLVEKAYPQLVETFKQSKIKPVKPSKRKKKQDSGNQMNTSSTETLAKKTRKTKVTKNKTNKENDLQDLNDSFNEMRIGTNTKKLGTLDNFFKKAVLNNFDQNNRKHQNIENKPSINNNPLLTSTPSKALDNNSVSLNFSDCLDDVDDDADLSNIVQRIISRKPNFLLDDIFPENFAFDEENSKNNSFFINYPVENDVFEKTFNEIIHIDSEDTEEYELGDLHFIEENAVSESPQDKNDNIDQKVRVIEGDNLNQCYSFQDPSDTDNNSFLGSDIDIPLIDRVKKKIK